MKKNQPRTHPAASPVIAKWLLRTFLPKADRDFIVADLDEEFSGRDRGTNGLRSRVWYRSQTFSLLSRYLWEGVGRTFTSFRQAVRAQAKGDIVHSSWQDIQLGLRVLRRQPGFAVAAFLTLAIGIGANTTIFSLINAVLLRPFAYSESDRLVIPSFANPSRNMSRISVPHADFEDWRAEQDLFEGAAIVSRRSYDIAQDGEPTRLQGLRVTEDYFSLMRAKPLLGRVFADEEFKPSASGVVVLGKGLWKGRFGGRSTILGSLIDLSGIRYQVIGVVESDQLWPPGPQLWTPLSFGDPPPQSLNRRDNFSYRVVARLGDTTTPLQAEARLAEMARRVAQEPSNRREGWTVEVFSLRDWILVPNLRLALYVLMGAVGFILLIACVNMANLMLARAIGRAHEVGIRLALGAGRRRLVRLLLAESLALSLGGAVGGLAIASLSLGFLKTAPLSIPRLAQAEIDVSVLLFTLLVSIATALVFGTLPALYGSRSGNVGSLLDSGRGNSPGASARRLRGLLVSAEVALALVLLIGAGLMISSFAQLYSADPGIRRDHLLTLGINLPNSRYSTKEEAETFFQGLLERLRSRPGVISAAAVSSLPILGQGMNLTRAHLTEGAPEPPEGVEFAALWNVVSTDYFRALGIPVVKGRAFESRDRSDGVPVIIMNQALADRMFPDRDPLGQRIRSWRDENLLRQVVGVVGNVRHSGMDDEKRPMVYVPSAQLPWNALGGIVLHTQADPGELIDDVRSEVWAVDPRLPIANVRVIDEILGQAVASERFISILLGVFAAISVVLAAIGIYGVISFTVGRQTYEIGIRLALGAQKSDVVQMIFRQGLLLTALGTLGGLAASLALWRVAASLLYQVSASDPWIYLAGALLLATVALAAGLIPALKATGVDPLSALRRP